jgi:hypothetical protein
MGARKTGVNVGLVNEPALTCACRQGVAASMNSGVNRWTQRYDVDATLGEELFHVAVGHSP